MKWYKHDPSAFLEGVMGLTAEERGFYITVIDLLYARDGYDVRDELVCNAMACRPQMWRRVKASLMAKGKVREIDGNLTANRVETTLKLAFEHGVSHGVSKGTLAKINSLDHGVISPRIQNPEYTSYVAAVDESKKLKKKTRSAGSLASALPTGALARQPEISPSLEKIVQAKGWKP